MIPRAIITEWIKYAPWKTNEQIEQDLVICRALFEIYSDTKLSEKIYFRGGTAIYKLFMPMPVRYSEDIDLVQKNPGPVSDLIDKLRKALSFLGDPSIKQKRNNNILIYRFNSEIPPTLSLKIKIEINCREHFSVYKTEKKIFIINSRWFSGKCNITTYNINELLGTKIRALYQRKKGRDLFDIWYILNNQDIDSDKTIKAFEKYMDFAACKVSKKQYQNNVNEKLLDPDFRNDTNGLLRSDIEYNIDKAWEEVNTKLIEKL